MNPRIEVSSSNAADASGDAKNIDGCDGVPKLVRDRSMKDNIHPKYVECTVRCGCGNSFVTRATKPEMKVDICSKCHPFYTGRVKFVDSAGRIEKFKNKFSGKYGKKA